MAHLSFFTKLFLVAALWNLTGAIFGFFNTAFTFEVIFNRMIEDPLMLAVYKGAWGTTLIYFIGYLIVARNPEKHYGIVITGGIGKLGYIITLLQLYVAGIASPIIFIIVIGDSIFLILFSYYFFHLLKSADQNWEKTLNFRTEKML
ncbi:hypothetical protein [Marinobacter sp.]|uniref:hypothetical protein n=1 Tax=Marinobacter sp. TaxID=50741 RepID=UPI00384FDCBD